MRSRLRSFIDYIRFVYGSEWVYVVGLIGAILGLITTGLPKPLLFGISVAALIITLLFLVRDFVELRGRWVGVRMYNHKNRLNDFPFAGAQWEPEAGLDHFVELGGSVSNGQAERIWRDPGLNRGLTERAALTPVALRSERDRYRLPRALKDIAPQALRRTSHPNDALSTRSRRPVWFNGKLCRLSTEPTNALLGASALHMQKVSYFDGQASNELWHWSFDKDLASDGQRIPRDHAVDTNRKLLGLAESRMANIVGITVFAITSDGQVVFVKQSSRNSVLPDGFVASASGSLDWIDARGRRRAFRRSKPAPADMNLQSLLMTGMLRELEEESQVRPGEVVEGSERITGYFRWLSRGAKPEFTGLVRLSVSAAELAGRNVQGAERLYTSGHTTVPLQLMLDSARSWTSDQHQLYDALRRTLPHFAETGAGLEGPSTEQIMIGASSIAAWCAAADFLSDNPDYLQNSRE